jgi:hypothetical protein
MRSALRPIISPIVLTLLLATPCTLRASGNNKSLQLDEQQLAALEQRAQSAGPRDQCFLYTELVSAMTDMAGKEMLDGDPDRASATLKKVEKYAQLIHMNLARDTKRLKNAQMMMHSTTYRLNEYLHEASSEDQATLKATLKQLNQVQDELLNQVFSH